MTTTGTGTNVYGLILFGDSFKVRGQTRGDALVQAYSNLEDVGTHEIGLRDPSDPPGLTRQYRVTVVLTPVVTVEEHRHLTWLADEVSACEKVVEAMLTQYDEAKASLRAQQKPPADPEYRYHDPPYGYNPDAPTDYDPKSDEGLDLILDVVHELVGRIPADTIEEGAVHTLTGVLSRIRDHLSTPARINHFFAVAADLRPHAEKSEKARSLLSDDESRARRRLKMLESTQNT